MDVTKIAFIILIITSFTILYIVHNTYSITVASFPLDKTYSISLPPRLEHIILYKNIANETTTTIVLKGPVLQTTIEPAPLIKYDYVIVKSRGVDIYVVSMIITGIIVFGILWTYILRELSGRAKTIITLAFLIALVLALANTLIASLFSTIPYSIAREQKGTLHLLNPAGTIGYPLLPKNYTMYLFKEHIDTEKIMVFESNRTNFIVIVGTKNFTKGIEMNPSNLFVIHLNKSFIGKKIYIFVLVPTNSNVKELSYREVSFYEFSAENINRTRIFLYFITPTIYLLALIIAMFVKKNIEYYKAKFNKNTQSISSS
ncbi:hypothetical protein J4526_05520 [Desulfurococcaceae archaeon MEX13E-LK6-19]|nr:hypothetical protein J4526_05520 [Desulfurococcaceae archaeon MEX13E-LK6-19]